MAIIQVKINQSLFVFEDWVLDDQGIWKRVLSFPVIEEDAKDTSERGIEIHPTFKANKEWQAYWNGPLLIETFDLAHSSIYPCGVIIIKSIDECKSHVDTFLIKVNKLKAFL